ncbi:8186_t:CDS:1 [Funneliformis caledonium]|uniref:8186_t:CDS:1 n=2 Tax=Funneliformis TaxID=1117308 RepID=A0A9N8WEJ6_9GLOM|nr:1910_t:CDS:1 [Funneliformis mosseae]CAG8486504.1 8186_t:CDS:1 [Funneliformis caledonium]
MNINLIKETDETTNNDNDFAKSSTSSTEATEIQAQGIFPQSSIRKFFPLIIPTTTNPFGEYIPIHIAIQRFQRSPVNQNPPYYEVPVLGNLPTVRHAYAEWYFGIDENPAIISCIRKYGKEWEKRNQRRLSRRKILIREIELRETDFSTEEVLEILEILRDGSTLNKLIDVKLLGHDK